MTDTSTPPPSPDPSFGAGIPAEAVEPVRLAPGLAHGPALDVRGQVAEPSPPVPAPHAFEASPQAPPTPVAKPQPSPAPAPEAPPQSAVPVQPQPAPGVDPAPGPAASQPAPGGFASPPPAYAAQPPPAPPPAGPAAAPTPAPRPPRRWWIALAHLLFLVPFPPGVIVTAVLWIWRRSRDPLMADQGREAINMQLTFWLAIGLLGATCLGSPLVPFVYVLGAVLCVLAAIAASGGDRHRYPWVFRFIA